MPLSYCSIITYPGGAGLGAGVQDITRLGKVYSASRFKSFETYSIVALMYLLMTLGLAMLVRWLEQRLEREL